MKPRKPFLFTMLALLLLLPSASVFGQQRGLPAMKALDRLAATHGSKNIQKIVRMRGSYGQSQPEEWWVVVYDPASPYLLREFWVSASRSTNEGPNNEFYPKQTPPGFIPLKNVKLDSLDAFEILNREAKVAKMGFDKVNYFLRCREFSDEPVWTLQALRGDGAINGIVDISAETAKVLRTVWMYREAGRRQAPRIVDSDLVGRQVGVTEPSPPTGVDERTLVEPADPPLDPLLRNPSTIPPTPPASGTERRVPQPNSDPTRPNPVPPVPKDPLSEEAEVIPVENDSDAG